MLSGICQLRDLREVGKGMEGWRGAGPGKLRTVRAGGPRHFVGRTWGGGRVVVGGAVVGRRDMNLLP